MSTTTTTGTLFDCETIVDRRIELIRDVAPTGAVTRMRGQYEERRDRVEFFDNSGAWAGPLFALPLSATIAEEIETAAACIRAEIERSEALEHAWESALLSDAE